MQVSQQSTMKMQSIIGFIALKIGTYIALAMLLFGCVHSSLFAQSESYTITGTIREKKSGEVLIRAVVRAMEPKKGALSNSYGFYSLTIPARLAVNPITINVSYIGFKTFEKKVTLKGSLKLDIELEEDTKSTEEVVVVAEKAGKVIEKAQTGVEILDVKTINKLPIVFGERDVLKTVQLLPGVKTVGEGNGGLYVRGGGTDQNLIQLDEAVVYNAYHLLGFFSTFNSDAIKDVTLFKGTAPAQFGGRASSVLDIIMNDGNNQEYHVGGGIGLIASRLYVEGPIEKGKGSFLVSARRTYADALLSLAGGDFANTQLYFYDINAKANYTLGESDKVFLSGYFGRDKLGLAGTFGIDWGNTTATFRWNHIFSEKFFSNTSFIYSNYSYGVAITNNDQDVKITSRIRDFNLKQEFQYFINPENTLTFGFNTIHHTVTPGQVEASESSSINNIKTQERYAWENALFASNEWKPADNMNITYGLRLSSFSLLGSGDFYTFNTDGSVANTTSYSSGEFVKTYLNLEPRLNMSYILDTDMSVKASYTRNTQNFHLISNSTASNPTDVWILSSNNIKPQIADQVSAGWFKTFDEGKYELSIESYYKWMQNQLDLKNGGEIRGNDKIDGELLSGDGRAYGIEFLLKKKFGDLSGWFGYTLSRTERRINGINNGDWYSARQDITHDISVTASYDLTPMMVLSGIFVFNTGNAVTFPSGKYAIGGQSQLYYTERNGYRMPDYHRLDLGLTWYFVRGSDKESSLSFSLYNAYGRENPYSIRFEQDPSNANRTRAVQTTLFRWVPSVTYNFKF
jgi:hypothetical protein